MTEAASPRHYVSEHHGHEYVGEANLKLIIEFLGEAYDSTQADREDPAEPLVVWFYPDGVRPPMGEEPIYAKASPGDWIVKLTFDDGRIQYVALSPEHYAALRQG
jgi:hypothetical protein